MINVYSHSGYFPINRKASKPMVFVNGLDEIRTRIGKPNSIECVYQVTNSKTIAYTIKYNNDGKPSSILQIEIRDTE